MKTNITKIFSLTVAAAITASCASCSLIPGMGSSAKTEDIVDAADDFAKALVSCDAGKIAKQTAKDIENIFGKVRTITYDNGVEFSLWKETEKNLGITIYFANPYHSWERGRNENTNGLIRDFFPKGTDFKRLTQKDILRVTDLINNRPRKRLQWLTPLEIYESQSVALEG